MSQFLGVLCLLFLGSIASASPFAKTIKRQVIWKDGDLVLEQETTAVNRIAAVLSRNGKELNRIDLLAQSSGMTVTKIVPLATKLPRSFFGFLAHTTDGDTQGQVLFVVDGSKKIVSTILVFWGVTPSYSSRGKSLLALRLLAASATTDFGAKPGVRLGPACKGQLFERFRLLDPHSETKSRALGMKTAIELIVNFSKLKDPEIESCRPTG